MSKVLELIKDIENGMNGGRYNLGPETALTLTKIIRLQNEQLLQQQETLECLGQKFEPDWSLIMAEAGIRGVALTSLYSLKEALKETNRIAGGES